MLIDTLRTARQSAGLSQRALAVRIGTTTQRIKRLEQGVDSVATVSTVMAAPEVRLTGLGKGKDLAAQLRACRLQRRLTLTEVAARAELSRTTVASLERGGGSVASLVRLLVVVAPRARRRAQERAYWGEGDKADRDVRFTPPELLAKFDASFGAVDLDPCGHALSPVAAGRRILLDEGGDGLVDDWSGALAFVNPPFSEMLRWLRRAHEQWTSGNVGSVICLVPARTDSRWFHDTLRADADIFFLQGRVRFLDPRGKAQHTPFALMLVALGTCPEQRARWAEVVEGFWLPPRPSIRLGDHPAGVAGFTALPASR